MTAIAIAIDGQQILLAADTLSRESGTGRPVADARKVFIKGRFAVATHGCGPPRVPETIDALTLGDSTAEAAAHVLCDVFKNATNCKFGIYVAGFDGLSPRLFHIDIPSGDGGDPKPRTENTSDQVALWRVSPNGAEHELERRFKTRGSSDLLSTVTNYVCDAHELAPEQVGGDIVRVRVTATDGAR